MWIYIYTYSYISHIFGFWRDPLRCKELDLDKKGHPTSCGLESRAGSNHVMESRNILLWNMFIVHIHCIKKLLFPVQVYVYTYIYINIYIYIFKHLPGKLPSFTHECPSFFQPPLPSPWHMMTRPEAVLGVQTHLPRAPGHEKFLLAGHLEDPEG